MTMAASTRRDVHITYRKQDGKWQTISEGSTRATKLFPTQEAAIQYGREMAMKRGVSIVVHGMDGKIRDVNSYDREEK